MAETPEQALERLRTQLAETPASIPAEGDIAADEALTRLRLRLGREGPPTPRRLEPPTTFAGLPIPRELRTGAPGVVLRGASEFAGGLNEAMANLAGLLITPVAGTLTRGAPGTAGREAFESMTGGQQITDDIARSQATVRSFLERLGVVPENMQDVHSIEAQVGREMLPAVLLAVGMISGSPAVARQAGSAFMNRAGMTTPTFIPASRSPAVEALGRFGVEVATHPATTARAVIGSQPGMTGLREALEPTIQSAFPGEGFGSQVGRTLTTFGVEMIGSIPSHFLATRLIPVPRAERFSPTTPHGEPILRDEADPLRAGQIARVRQVNLLDTIDRAFARTIQRVGEPGLDEATASRRFRQDLLAAREFTEAEVNRAYGEVDTSIRGAPGRFRDEVIDQLDFATREPSVADTVPVSRLRAIQGQLMAGRDASGNPIWRTDIPIAELNRMRSNLIQDARNAAEVNPSTGTNANRLLQENIDNLVGELTRSIETIGMVNPRFQPALDYANATYRMYNDRFRRGPIGEMLLTTRHTPFAGTARPEPVPGGAAVPPTEVGRRLLNSNEAAEAVFQAMDRIGRLRGNQFEALTKISNVDEAVDRTIRTMFMDDIMDFFVAQQAGARKPRAVEDIPTTGSLAREPIAQARYRAQRWLQQNAPLLESWVSTTRRLFNVSDRLNKLLIARDRQSNNVLSQFMGTDPRVVFEQALKAPDRAARFALMERSFRHNPEFLEGAQRAILDLVFAGRGADPLVALGRLRSTEYHEALSALFRNDLAKLDRLHEMLWGAAHVTGTAVRSNAAGAAQIVPGAVHFKPTERITRWLQSNIGHIVAIAAGGALARFIPGMGAAGSLSIPSRMSRGMRDFVAAAWLRDRQRILDIVKESVFNPVLEAELRDLAPGNFSQARASLERLNRYLRRFEALTNEDVDRVLSNGPRLYAEELRKVREEMHRLRLGPFRGRQ